MPTIDANNNNAVAPPSKIFVKIKTTSDTPSSARQAPIIKAETPDESIVSDEDIDEDADDGNIEVLEDVEMKDEEEAEKAKGLVKLKNHSTLATNLNNNAKSNVVSIKCTTPN